MLQPSNKLSSFIGITLLILVIAFTVFINFFVEEPVEEANEEKQEIVEEPKFRALNQTDLANLWRLENLQTDSIELRYDKERTYVQIRELKISSDYNRLKDSGVYKDFSDSIKQVIEQNYFKELKMVYCGALEFKNSYNDKQETIFNDVEIEYIDTTAIKTLELLDIGIIFLKYQIKSITTKPQIGDFTTIYLADGREIYLIKENTVVNGDYYKERLENAEYLNDSTKILLPDSPNL